MARIAYLLLCHKDPGAILRQAQELTAAGDFIAIHYDARAPEEGYRRIAAGLRDNSNAVLARRVRCGWGEWSLVQATLNAGQAALAAFPQATHFYMLSGDCMAIKSAEFAHQFLDAEDRDYIESVDFFRSDWIRTGWTVERLIYRHWFNERTQRRRFYTMYHFQRALGLRRRLPRDLRIHIGSQWWCLRRRTLEGVMNRVADRPDIVRFFRRSWIPDETFFQSLVRAVVPEAEIESRTLTFLMFTDYGMPVTFHDDHYNLLIAQNALFARKISVGASDLRRRLARLYVAKGVKLDLSDEGRALFSYLTRRGRDGRRFSPRIWESAGDLGRGRVLLVLICKKWHVAKRLAGWLSHVDDLACAEYVFDEEETPLPDLGGIEKTIPKRSRHRRNFLDLLYRARNARRLLICVDPARLDLLMDFRGAGAELRLLELDCLFSDAALAAHTRRLGLSGAHTAPQMLSHLLDTVRRDMDRHSAEIAGAGFDIHLRLQEGDPPERMAEALRDFIAMPKRQALEFANNPALFSE